MLRSIRRLLGQAPRHETPDAPNAAAETAPAAAADGRDEARLAEAANHATRGNRCVAEGRLQEAVACYEQALALDPRHVVACSNLGFALKQLGRLDEAASWLDKAVELDPGREEPYLFLGQIAELRGDAATAVRRLREALRRKPDFAFAWQELCRLQFQAGDAAQALQSARNGLHAAPESAMLNFYLGNLLFEQRDYRGAAAAYRRALQAAPDFAQAHVNLGRTLLKLHEAQEAADALKRATEIDSELAEAQFHLGHALQLLARFEEAAAAFEIALKSRPDDAESWYALGELAVHRHWFERARECFDRAYALDGDSTRRLMVTGNLLQRQGRINDAEAAYREALAIQPNFFDAYNNLGALLELDRPREAEAAYREALRLEPTNPTSRWNLSVLLLRLGRLREAWPFHEARYDPALPRPLTYVPALSFPVWRGESLAGRSVIVVGEQGFGDQIQLARYAQVLKERGAALVSLQCRTALKNLLASAPGVDAVFGDEEVFPTHDYWVLAFSLPGLLGTTLDTIPAQLPYLAADPLRIAAWAPRLPVARRRVGLVWKGAAGHGNDLNRSLPGLQVLAPLWSCPDTAFVSLQKGQGEDEAARAGDAQPITDLAPGVSDFGDTAAILAQLDLLICVDTSAAHVAGALGRPCWVLLPAVGCDWRWMLEREDSPWYPGVMRLFRQAPGEPWDAVVGRVAQALRAWSAAQA
ncbi:tetratricopeptide repeat protein [Thiomonas sp. FB-6]|uniref:tetratricopeptide repeat protein n=1 Tax=Thiomonas sp. FB-6 TaxID=1158291 RepID=UPI000361C254|nr:tetratricopeptide repeat protein [Thiomonas sp. FB-6]